jgi:hypothetical protein
LSTAASKAKQRWNKKHYSQVKVSVFPVVAQRFKAACVSADISMSSALVAFMTAYVDATDAQSMPASGKKQMDLASKRGRRKLLCDLFKQLQKIKDAEEAYRDSVPENMAERIRCAEEGLDALDGALEALSDAVDVY